jgi:hypothetical protein
MSQIVPIFRAEITDGILIFQDKEKYDNYVTSLMGKVEVLVRKPKKVRSNRQNRYYWGVVLKLISEETGEEMEDLHNHFSYKWLSAKGKSGRLMTRRSTTTLSTVEFMEYIDKIIVWAEQFLKITFPNPDEVEYNYDIL